MPQGSPAVDEASEVFTPLYPVRSKFVFFLPFQHGVVGGGAADSYMWLWNSQFDVFAGTCS